ncbi:MAG TPA: hypothetical protein DDZ74_19310 [Pseudomonas sp.]|nr:hypothetical protein [Pseudomonas sp.]
MNEVTDQVIDDAIDLLSRFRREFMDGSAKSVPTMDEVRPAISALITRYFSEDDYEIKNLLRVSESKKAVSYVELNSHLDHFVSYAQERRDQEKYNAIHGWPEDSDPWSDI